MRVDSSAFALANAAASKEPRFVIGIIFDVGSLYLTSHSDISSVPGTVFNGVLQDISALSQRLNPDQGRSEIGSISFKAVDISSALTTEFRSKLNSLQGLRGRTVKMWHGFKGDAYSALQLFQTQTITDVAFEEGVYSFDCEDITRQQRQEIFDAKTTTLRLSCTETDSEIFVADTSEFSTVYHGVAYTDAPSSTVGYFKLEDEIIRYTGKTPDSFTGCTRGVLNTRAKAHTADQTAAQDRRTKIDEVIYLEGPAVQLAYAINTGVIYGTAYTLPAHWNLGIATTSLRTADWTGIGPDLWAPADDTKGLILRFLRPKKQDGKAFLEKEINLLCGLYSPVYSDGTLGLKRMAALIRGAAPVLTLSEKNLISVGTLRHDMQSMRNQFRIQWSWDGNDFRRESYWIDGNSILVHKESEVSEYKFSGLVGARHTDVTIRQRLSQLGDRYASPPIRITATALGSTNRVEVGDVVRLNVANVRDFAGSTSNVDRSFEVQRVSVNYITGDVEFDLFGSTSKPTETPLELSGLPALPDAYYTQAGTNLASVMTIDGTGTISGGPYTLAGGSDITASGSTWYYAGDLTVGTGVTIDITGNVRLRVRGFLQVNGTISGAGGGLAGVADSGSATTFPDGQPGFVGNSRGRDGINTSQESGSPVMRTVPAKMVTAKYAVFPYHAINVDALTITGLPTDLRGSGGAPGGKVTYQVNTQRAAGGTGGNGGAGLLIECRGLACGVSGSINLNGTAGSAGTRYDDSGKGWNPGAGGGGGPGSLMVLLDGSTVSLPDLSGKFFATCGTVPTPALYENLLKYLDQPGDQRYSVNDRNYAGYDDPSVISGADLSDACLRIQYVPYPISATDDRDTPPPDLLGLTAIPGPGYNLVTVYPAESSGSTIELYYSLDGIVNNAILLQELTGTQFYHALVNGETRYYHARAKRQIDANTILYSSFFPGTVVATADTAIVQDLPEERDFLDTFEHQDVLAKYDSAYGSGTFSYPANGSYGGRVLQVASGSRALIWKENIPIDPTGVYRISARVRQTVAPTNASADGIYLGVRAISSDASTVTGDVYVGAANFDLGSVATGTWVTVVGYFNNSTDPQLSPALDINNPSGLPAGSSYIRPIFWANYLDGDGTQQFDYIRVEKLVAGRWEDLDGEGKPSDYADNTFLVTPTAVGTFFDSFDHQDVWKYYEIPPYNTPDDFLNAVSGVSVSYPLDGINGGRVLQVTGDIYFQWRRNVALDPDAVYRLTARVRRTAAGASGQEKLMLGYAGLAADGVTYINRVGANSYGTQHYQHFYVDMGALALGEWTEIECWAGGLSTTVTLGDGSPDNPMRFYEGVKYFRPVFEANNTDGTGTVQFDFIRIEKVLQGGQLVPGAAFVPYQATTATADVYNSGSTSTQVVSVSVPAQNVATEQIVTVVGNIDHNAGTGTQGSTFALITDAFSSGQSYATEDTIARNPSTSLLRTIQSFSLERKYSISAGTAKTYSLSALGFGTTSSGASCLMKAVRMVVKVHKA